MRAVIRFGRSGFAAVLLLAGFVASHAEERLARAGDIRIELPETAPPPVTDGQGSMGFRLPLPEPPATSVVIDRKELAGLLPPEEPKVDIPAPDLPPLAVILTPETDEKKPEVQPLPAIPPGPLLAIVPPMPPVVAPQEKLQGKPEEPRLTEQAPSAVMPQEILRSALLRLKAGTRITNAEAADVLSFYEARGFAPIWQDSKGWNAQGQSLRGRLSQARDDGLDPSRYRSVASFVQPGEPNWPALAAAEAQLTESAILYAREASVGRVAPRLVHEFITPQLKQASARSALEALSTTPDAGAALQAFNPPHVGYQLLRKALGEVRTRSQQAFVGDPIPDGPVLRVGMRDARVPLIRARLGLGYDASPVYDRRIGIKLAAVQRENGLPSNGLFTAATARLLSGERPTLEEAEIIANMERWRWLPRELGVDHIWVNAPEQRMEMIRAGSIVHTATAIIGTLETQTPVFSDEMDHIVVNPSWFVPPGILKKEPKYTNEAYAKANGYTIRRRGENVTVRVPPGPTNPLGYVKFMFPNDHAVYLHDTPKRGLFNARVRTLSNGCVRVQNPFQLAAKIFEDSGWTEERFKKLIGGGEQRMNLPRKLPIHLTYFTMTIDGSGSLQKHPDFYGHSAKLRQLLGLS